MEPLSYQYLKQSGYAGFLLQDAPEKILQFGEGNFLRAFVNDWFDRCNELVGYNAKVCLVQPIAQGLTQQINEQQGLYTLYLRGLENGEQINQKRIISCVSRCLNPYERTDYEQMLRVAASDALEIIISNTTEAGIVYDPACQLSDCPPSSFPGKLTQVLYHRWQAGKAGLILLSCELIDDNGKQLLACVKQYATQWNLGDAFVQWLTAENHFCSTLVDRIVTGHIRDTCELAAMEQENGYHDALMDVGEHFGVWIIEGPASLEARLPFHRAGVNVHVVPDVTPYKKRKVRILNGAHTGFVLGGYLAGFDFVRECIQDTAFSHFIKKMLYDEVIPTLPLERENLIDFAKAVQERFNNPFVEHQLLSISLNSTSKWKARNLPSLLEYWALYHTLPTCLSMSLAACIAFFSSDIQALIEHGLVCKRPKGDVYTACDDRWVLEFYYAHRNDHASQLAHAVLGNEQMWGQNLNQIPDLTQAVISGLDCIRTAGAGVAFSTCL